MDELKRDQDVFEETGRIDFLDYWKVIWKRRCSG